MHLPTSWGFKGIKHRDFAVIKVILLYLYYFVNFNTKRGFITPMKNRINFLIIPIVI